MTSPAIILVRPQMGENIGAAARVMQNFGLVDLRIVAPRDGWPNETARSMAAKGVSIIDAAPVFDSLADAVGDCQHVLATTARERQISKPSLCSHALQGKAFSGKVGLVFGPERTGLENEEVALADTILYVPTSEENPSLNLAQAVAVMAYEWSKRAPEAKVPQGEPPASKQALQGLFGHLEAELDSVNFWKVEHKKSAMWANIRNSLQKAALTDQEVRTWRGIIRSLREQKR